MAVDQVDLLRVQAGGVQGVLYGLRGAPGVGVGGHQVMGVGGQAVAGQLGVDPGSPAPGMLQLLQAEHTGPFAEHEAVPVLVEGPGGGLRRIVALRQGHDVAEGRQGVGVDRGLGPAREDRVGQARLDHHAGHREGVIGGGAGRVHGETGSLQVPFHGQVAGGGVGDAHDEERGGGLHPVLDDLLGIDEVRPYAAVPGGDERAIAVRCLVHLQPRILDGLRARHLGQHHIAVQPAGHLAILEVQARVRQIDFPRDLHGVVVGGEGADAPHSRLALDEILPVLGNGISNRGDGSQARDHHADFMRVPQALFHLTGYSTGAGAACQGAGASLPWTVMDDAPWEDPPRRPELRSGRLHLWLVTLSTEPGTLRAWSDFFLRKRTGARRFICPRSACARSPREPP